MTIRRRLKIADSEITVQQFQNFRPNYPDSGKFSPYVSGISWDDAVAFCDWLSEKEGKKYRLPTEAEWEYVCRAGTSSLFSTGSTPPPHETANPWGVRNMHTGVMEWCLDWHGTYPGTDQIDPAGPASGIARIVRGGSVQEQVPDYTRSANCAGAPQSWRGQHLIGFRIVEASLPDSRPVPLELPFVQRCVKQVSPPTGQRLDPDQPHYRKRWILPIPPETCLLKRSGQPDCIRPSWGTTTLPRLRSAPTAIS